MKPPAYVLLAACVAAMVGALPSVAADAPAASKELVKVSDSKKVTTAFWTRRENSYTLQLMVPVPFTAANVVACLKTDPAYGQQPAPRVEPPRVATGPRPNSVQSIAAGEMEALGIINVADALLKLVPRNLNVPPPALPGDGRPDVVKVVASQQQPPKVVQVWLLRADGTQVPPIATSAGSLSERKCGALRDPVEAATRAGRYDDEITYRFPMAESEQAVAAAIMVDNDFYIEKL